MGPIVAFLITLLASQPAPFSGEEKAKVIAHGPWPPAAPVAARPEAIAFGERLFFEPRLSGTGSVLCATCHVPYRRFQDGRARAFGLEEADRNTPTLLDVRLYRRFGWEGARDSLAVQSIRPLLEPREMRSSSARVAGFVRTRAAADYEKAFGHRLPAADEEILLDVGRALAAYEETLVSGRTPFDDYRDALAHNDAAHMGGYPAAAQRGLRLFVARCDGCHAGPTFSSSAVVNGFRVAALRNVASTAPYMHDGHLAGLRDAVGHQSPGVSAEETDDLVAFLQSLSER